MKQLFEIAYFLSHIGHIGHIHLVYLGIIIGNCFAKDVKKTSIVQKKIILTEIELCYVNSKFYFGS